MKVAITTNWKVTNISVVFQDVQPLNTSKKLHKNIFDGDSHLNTTLVTSDWVGTWKEIQQHFFETQMFLKF